MAVMRAAAVADQSCMPAVPIPSRAAVLVSLVLVSTAARAQDHPEANVKATFETLLAASPPEDSGGRLRLCAWAEQNELVDEAEDLCRAILEQDPLHSEAYQLLIRLASQRPLPMSSETYEATRKLLPKSFRVYETARFVILSNVGRRRARAQADLLERTHAEFRRHTERLRLRPLPLRHKLVCVLLRSRSEFLEFASRHDQVTESWAMGYYSPRNHRTVFYNAEAEPDADPFARQRALATTIHEAIHQLHYHTRVQTRYVQYPLWSCEGLATAFETDRSADPFGPDHEFRPRHERFRRLLSEDRLLSLRALIQLDRMPDSRRETVHIVYNQSYALVSWLTRHRRHGLREYLMLMLREPPGRPSPQRHLELFEQAFGNVEVLEQAWLLREKTQRRGQR